MKIRRKPKEENIIAITFDELVEHGRNNGANIVNGMPWSFQYMGHPVTHENDNLYIVANEHFHRGDMLVSEDGKQPVPFSRAEFEKEYEAMPEEKEVTVRELLAWAKDQPACPGFGETIENIEQLTEEFLTEKGAY